MQGLTISAIRAVRSLFTPGMFSVFAWSIAITIATLLAFIGSASSFFIWLGNELEFQYDWATYVPWAGSIGAGILAWFLFPGIMPVIVNFFGDRIARLIERHDYPSAANGSQQPFLAEFLYDLRFSLTAILLNLLVLPLYLLPVLNLILFYLLNGYLLGREFFVMAARRHMKVRDANALRLRHSRTVMAAGIILAVMATIPILNLFAPFWGVAVMVHLYHRLAATPTVPLSTPV